ncbi:hypothetical protein vseg_004559 [Gypsophila vaccaria]
MEEVGGKKITSLVKLVQERSILKMAEVEERKIKKQQELESSVCPLSDDCVSCILVRLPICSLQRSSCVCKPWSDMVHNPIFIQDHLRRSEFVILIQACVYEGVKASDFSVESSVPQLTKLVPNPLCIHTQTTIQFMHNVDGKAVIRDFNISCLGTVAASCNGLLLIEYKGRNIGMVVMNPVTRKCVFLRLGTISSPEKESYGFVYDQSANQYKVVHLFDDESGHTSCEIMVVGARYWKMVDGPSFGLIKLFSRPVSAIGALHWLPNKLHNEFIVSMEIEKETFRTIELPATGGLYDDIAELGDFLCFTSHRDMCKMDIWALKSLSEETWTRFHTITAGYVMDLVPISGSRSGRQIIFTQEDDTTIYIYDFGFEAGSTIVMKKDKSVLKYYPYLPHVNSLVSWSV